MNFTSSCSSCALTNVLWVWCIWLVLHALEEPFAGAVLDSCCYANPITHYCSYCSFSLSTPPSFFHDLPFVCCLSLGRIQAAPCWLASLSEQLMGCLPEHMIIGWYIPAYTILSCFWTVVSLQSKNNKKWRNRGKRAQKRDLPTFLARFMPFSTNFVMGRISKFWRELPNDVFMSHMTDYIWL